MLDDCLFVQLNYGLGIGLDPRIEVLKLPTMEYEVIGDITSNKLTFTGFGMITSRKKYDNNLKSWVAAVSPSHLQYSSAHMLSSNSCPVLGNRKLKMCAKLDNPNAAVCPVSVSVITSMISPLSKKSFFFLYVES